MGAPVTKHRSRPLGEWKLLALAYLQKHGPQTASNLGAALWGSNHSKPQSYARPAGKLLHALLRDGTVHKIHGSHHTLWGYRGR